MNEESPIIGAALMEGVSINYDLPQGQWTLRQQITRMLVQQGLEATPEDLIITNGETALQEGFPP